MRIWPIAFVIIALIGTAWLARGQARPLPANNTGTVTAPVNTSTVTATTVNGTTINGTTINGTTVNEGGKPVLTSATWTYSAYFSTYADVEIDSTGTNRPASTIQSVNCTARQGNSGSDAGADRFWLSDTTTGQQLAECLFVCNTAADTRTSVVPTAFCQQRDAGPVQGVPLPAGHSIRWGIGSGGCSVTDTGADCTVNFSVP